MNRIPQPRPGQEGDGSTSFVRRHLLTAIAWVAVITGGGLILFTFTAEPAGAGKEIVIGVSGDAFPISVAGEEITSPLGLMRANTSEAVVRSECGGNIKDITFSDGKPTKNVIVIKSSSGGLVCIGEGDTQTIGQLKVTARNAGHTVSDGNGHIYTSPDDKDIYFRELGIRTVGSTPQGLFNLVGGILLALGGGLFAELLRFKYGPKKPNKDSPPPNPDDSTTTTSAPHQ